MVVTFKSHKWYRQYNALLEGRRNSRAPLPEHEKFEGFDWSRLPSNRLASADEMQAAGWAMDHGRDERGIIR